MAKHKYWTAEEEQWLRDNHLYMTYREMWEHFGVTRGIICNKLDSLGLRKTKEAIKVIAQRLQYNGQFGQKKNIPESEYRIVEKTNHGHTHLFIHVGHNHLIRLSHYNWAKVHGPIDGSHHTLQYIDGNYKNCAVENLRKVTYYDFARGPKELRRKPGRQPIPEKQAAKAARKAAHELRKAQWEQKRKDREAEAERKQKAREARRNEKANAKRRERDRARYEKQKAQQEKLNAIAEEKRAKKAERERQRQERRLQGLLTRKYRHKVEQAWEQQGLRNKKRQKRYEVREVNLSEKVAVRINAKTVVYVNKGADIERIIAKYKQAS